jgi:hypothetical protein
MVWSDKKNRNSDGAAPDQAKTLPAGLDEYGIQVQDDLFFFFLPGAQHPATGNDPWQGKAHVPFGGQVDQLYRLVAGKKTFDLQVRMGAVIEPVVEVGGHLRAALGPPGLVEGAGIALSGQPGAVVEPQSRGWGTICRAKECCLFDSW